MRVVKNALVTAAVIGLVSAQMACAQAPPAAAPAAAVPAAAVPAAAPAAPAKPVWEVGQPAIDFTVKDFVTNKDFTLSAELKKKKMLFVWISSSCSTCLAEMNELKQAQDEGKIKDTAVYVVSIDFKADNIATYAKDFVHKDFTVLHDPKFASAQKYRLRATPSSLIIDKAGNIAYKNTGFEAGDSKALLAAIAAAK